MTTVLAIFGLAFALSLALTPAARWVGMRLGAVDVPNEAGYFQIEIFSRQDAEALRRDRMIRFTKDDAFSVG